MILDWWSDTGRFTLQLNKPLETFERIRFREETGLDYSTTTGLYFTAEPYAAVEWYEHATPRAADQLMSLQWEIESSWRDSSQAHIKCPPDQELLPFQKAGIEYALRRRNTLIGDQPGLGKTMQAICYANEIGAKRVLVLAPAAIRLQWVTKIRQWTTMRWPFTVYPIISGKHGVHPEAQWTVVSYDLARSPPIWRALVEAARFDLLIIDEGHYLKTVDALRTRALFGGGDQPPVSIPIASRCEQILDLTGTPLPNRPREAYTAARNLDFASIDFLSEERFQHRFNPSAVRVGQAGNTYVDERAGRHGELQARLRVNFMVRRLKRDVQPQLKLPTIELVHVDPNGDIREALRLERLIEAGGHVDAGVKIDGQVSTARRLMGRGIAPFAAQYVDMLLEGGEERVLLACWHTEVLAYMAQHLAKWKPLFIDGSTPPGRRPKIVEAFAKARLCVVQMLAAGIGTDGLQGACSRGVCCEPDWVPGNNQQLVDRLDRMGQKDKVLFSFLVAEGSIAERIVGSAAAKEEEIEKTLDRRRPAS